MNRTVFFDRLRATPFGGVLTQAQVEGMSAILDAAPAYGIKDVRHLAYALATTFHETNRTMQPIKEYGGSAYFKKMYDINGERPHVAKALGNTLPGDGAKFAGRGYVQLTGRTNYSRASGIVGADLLASPDLAMRPDYAAKIMFDGMTKGWFTGVKFSTYFSASKNDPVNARRIINGTDKAETIAGYHAAFLTALSKAGWAASDPPSAPTTPTPQAPSKAPFSIWRWLKSLFTRSAK